MARRELVRNRRNAVTESSATMQTTLGGLALAVALGAALVAGYGLLQGRSPPADLAARLDALDARMERLESSGRRADEPAREEATLVGSDTARTGPREAATSDLRSARPPSPLSDPQAAAEAGVPVGNLAELVDEAVARKASQLRVMQTNKKPSIDLFTETIGLTEDQRREVEDAVVGSQHEIQALLETPAADGTVLLDELVEVFADGMAHPGEDPARGQKFFGRLLTETVPGTNATYAMQAEAIKARLRDAFRRALDEKQYAAFEAWQMDPTEIQEIPGSPWKELERRIVERARDLGARIPQPAGR